MYKRILVPLDGSELSEMALIHAHGLARPLNAAVILLYVVVFSTRDFDVIPMQAAASPQVIREAKRYLERAAGQLRRLGVTVTTQVESGYVADTIIDFAENQSIDLIVMSTHGRTGAARWIIGSVADRIVHGARVPVLLVRPETQGGRIKIPDPTAPDGDGGDTPRDL